MAKFEGRGACDCCERGVDVFSDKNGMAYYNCGPCGFRGQHRMRRTSDGVLAGLDRAAESEEGAKAPPTVPPAPDVPSAPAVRVAPPPGPPKPKPATPAPEPVAPPAKKAGGFLSNFHL